MKPGYFCYLVVRFVAPPTKLTIASMIQAVGHPCLVIMSSIIQLVAKSKPILIITTAVMAILPLTFRQLEVV